mgnify:CR=1 FL=1
MIGAVVGLLVLTAGPGLAHANNYGAIAFSPSTGAHGWANDFSSRAGAERAAMNNCLRHAGDCRIATWFRNACGALAVGSGNGYGASWASSRSMAERLSVDACSRHTGRCYVRRWVCTGR